MTFTPSLPLESTALLAVALFTEVELPTAPDHSHDHIPLHGTHWYLHLDFFLGGIQPSYTDNYHRRASANTSRLRTYPFHVEEKVLMLHDVEFRSHLRMVMNAPSFVYKSLHEYQILRVSNSPHLYELCPTLSVVTQHLPLCMVSSFTKRPALP
ncbi:hypothetical protein BHE74_00044776 [Ensete ventricosum]|nr:hypothetical protein BHE74_00044776 [Ensete ventricosum]